MRITLLDRIGKIKSYIGQICFGLMVIPFAILALVWELIKLLTIHPILWCWCFFEVEFIVAFYFKGRYDNLDKEMLDLINIHINRFNKESRTIGERVYRWKKFKILKRNNYEYDEKLTWENQGNYSKDLKTK